MATNTEPDDLRTTLAERRREPMAAQTLDSDFDFSFQIQIREAIAASLALHLSVSSDGVLGVAETLPHRETKSHMQEYHDRKHSEAESSKARDDLDRRIHDQRLANDIQNLADDYWSEYGDWYENPYAASSSSSSSSSSKVLVEPEALKLYFKGLVSEERVWDSDMVVAGAGIAICDSEDNLLFQCKKSLDPVDGGDTISSGVAELEALVEGLNRALEFGFQNIVFFCDDDMIFLHVTNKLQPKDAKVVELVNQVVLLRRKFTYCCPSHTCCCPSLVAHDNIKLALSCAREAIVSQITWSKEAGQGKSLKETCLICFEDTDVAQMFTVDGCLHRYCFSCMKQHVEAKLHNGQIPRCPHYGCNSEVAVYSCTKFLPPNLVELLRQRVKESTIPVTQKVYCPDPKCSALMSKDEVLEYAKPSFIDAEPTGARKCMKCRKFFCINCKVPWHYSVTCKDYRRDNPHEDEQMLKSLATKKRWRQCPKCSHMIELMQGCSHITCRCKCEFCYTCGAEWNNKRATCSCPLWSERDIILQQRLPELDLGQRGHVHPRLGPRLRQQLLQFLPQYVVLELGPRPELELGPPLEL